VIGLPFLGPPAIRVAAAAGARLPVAPRLALRDLARHQARSGAALAGISLALAVPALVVIESAGSPPPPRANLSDRQLMIRLANPYSEGIPDRTPAQAAATEVAVRDFTVTVGAPIVIGLDVAMDQRARRDPVGGRTPVSIGELIRDAQNRIRSMYGLEPGDGGGALYVASPELMRYLGIDPGKLGPGTEVLTVHPGTIVFLSDAEDFKQGEVPPPVPSAPMARPAYEALPTSLLNPATVQRRGWTTVRAGWLIEAGRPLTTAQVAAARAMAVQNGLSVETKDTQASLMQLRAGATGAGGVLALGVLAMTVGLIRGEAARDLRTLTATGATRRIRRTLTATTAGALAFLGAVLGVAVAYLTLAGIQASEIGRLGRVPVVELAITLVGVPLVAAAAAWLLAGREPRSLVRDA